MQRRKIKEIFTEHNSFIRSYIMSRFTRSNYALFAALVLSTQSSSSAFTVINPTITSRTFSTKATTTTTLFNKEEPTEEEIEAMISNSKLSEEEVAKVGNLVADDEWMGLGMELSELVRVAVIEEAKKNTAEFIGKEDYKVGDITKEIDERVKVRCKQDKNIK